MKQPNFGGKKDQEPTDNIFDVYVSNLKKTLAV